MHGTDDERLRVEVRSELDVEVAARTRSEWEEALEYKEAMVGVVRSPKEALLGPYFTERGVVQLAERKDTQPRVDFLARSSAVFKNEKGSAPGSWRTYQDHPPGTRF